MPAKRSLALAAAEMIYLAATILYCVVISVMVLLYLVLLLGFAMFGPGGATEEGVGLLVFFTVCPVFVVVVGFIGVHAVHCRTSLDRAMACGALAALVSGLVATLFTRMTLDGLNSSRGAVIYLWATTLLYVAGMALVGRRQSEFPVAPMTA